MLLVAWGAAFVVFRTAPTRPLNRRLSLVLLLEGLFQAGASGLLFFFEDPRAAAALGTLGTAAMVALPLQYLSFLAASLETPLVAPFRSRAAVAVLALASGAAAALVLWTPFTFITEPYHPGWAPWNVQFRSAGQRGAQVHGLASIFGLVAAISAYLRTRPGTAARSRAMWFAFAFGVRDIYVGAFQILYPLVRSVPFWGDFVYNPGQGLAYLAYVFLLAYGVLRTQLFDIDLRFKIAIQHSAVGAFIGGAFLVGSELLERIVPVHGTLLGLLAALGIVAALRPIRRLAEGFANRLLPGVRDTPTYLEARKLSVYRAAVEGAVQDGTITERERTILTRLRQELGIPPEEAATVEREFTADRAVP